MEDGRRQHPVAGHRNPQHGTAGGSGHDALASEGWVGLQIENRAPGIGAVIVLSNDQASSNPFARPDGER